MKPVETGHKQSSQPLNPFTIMRISSYPRQFIHKVIVEIITEQDEHCIISLTNQNGRIRVMMGVNIIQGLNNIVVDKIGSLEAGSYNLQVKNTDAHILYRTELIKQ